VPGDDGVNGLETYAPLPTTRTVEVKTTGPAQVVSAGPNTLNVIVPVRFVPPASVAVSVTVSPTLAVGVTDVVIVGVALATVVDSPAVPHGEVADAFDASPEYVATHWYEPAAEGTNGSDW
jgi:hypothetical protein